jgi:hypothetical protein
MKYNIDTTIEGDYDDHYASYDLVAEGNTLDELIADAHIFEVGQDGDSLRDYKLEDAGNALYDISVDVMKSHIKDYSDESKR